jgi:hypothetical protein
MHRTQFVVQASNLPKSFGFLLSTSLQQINDRPVSFKALVGRSFIEKLYFSFNINNFILNENRHYYQNEETSGSAVASQRQRENLQSLNLSQQVGMQMMISPIRNQLKDF